MAIFLQSSLERPENQERITETRQIMMCEGINTDLVQVKGHTRLEQMWNGILLGDYVAYYLAMCYEVDPTPIPSIMALKESMSR
jgi:glucose/mannose-6-phosphate isomerase